MGTKHAGKTRVGLWGQSSIWKAAVTRYKKKGKVLEDFYKGKIVALKVLVDFQELTLHEFVDMSSL